VTILQRCFLSFPNGLPGVALLALRAAVGAAALAQGLFYLRGSVTSPPRDAAGLVEIGLGAMLVAGFITPAAGVGSGLILLGIRLSLLPSGDPLLLDSNVVLGFWMSILFASVILGPGAFSVDARVFGRREIIIPPRTRPT
jgi:uncharacterized membrane protein YphA (DoxX/SURF4 family)